MKKPSFFGAGQWLLLALLGLTPTVLAQSLSGSANALATPDPAQATLQAYQKEQQILGQSFGALIAQNPTPQQIQAWQMQNEAGLSAQQQRAISLGMDSALQPLPIQAATSQPIMPSNASQTMKDFLAGQTALGNARAQIHNQLLDALPQDVTDAEITQMEGQETQLFMQQHAADLQLQAQRAQTLAQESAATPIPTPPPFQLPPGCSAQMAAYLTLRDQLARDQTQMLNQQVNATPAARNAAVQQWLQQNASRFQQLQTLAQTLSQSPPTQ
jgi:hypothetical protein